MGKLSWKESERLHLPRKTKIFYISQRYIFFFKKKHQFLFSHPTFLQNKKQPRGKKSLLCKRANFFVINNSRKYIKVIKSYFGCCQMDKIIFFRNGQKMEISYLCTSKK